MNDSDLERLISAAFTERGFTVSGFGGGSNGAADLALVRDAQRFLVQLRHWRKGEIGMPALRELAAAMRCAGARGGFAVTRGRFARQAREFALEARIQLIDGEALGRLQSAALAAV